MVLNEPETSLHPDLLPALGRLIAQAAQQYRGEDQQRFIQYVQQDPMAAAQLRAPLYEDKVVDFLFDKAEISDREATREELEAAIAAYLGFEDAILFAAAFDANGGLFEPLLGAEDAIVSDSLNHASIIDGVRLCKAKRYRFANSDMNELESRLKEARAAGARLPGWLDTAERASRSLSEIL